MKRYWIAISILTLVVSNLWGQNYRLLIGIFEEPLESSYFDSISEQKTIQHEIDAEGFHFYYLEGFSGLDEVQQKELELFQKGYMGAAIYAVYIPSSPENTFETSAKSTSIVVHEKKEFEAILFDSGKHQINLKGKEILIRLRDHLLKHPSHQVLIEGHTDALGSSSYNKKLAKKRTRVVRDYLANKGITSARLILNAYGECKPKAVNKHQEKDAPEGRRYNRRVDFLVFDQNGTKIYSTSASLSIPKQLQIKSSILVRQ